MKKKILRNIDYGIEVAALSTREILLSLIDLAAPVYEAHHTFRRSAEEYMENRIGQREKFFERLAYLRRKGYIETFVENKKYFIELTPEGFKHTQRLHFDEIKVKTRQNWDKKWRIVIFDVPEKKRYSRDLFRHKLKELCFIQIQKSVYAYPFECAKEIMLASSFLNISQYVTIMIADIIQGEEAILEYYLKEKIIKRADLEL